jgi:hypothetical protein
MPETQTADLTNIDAMMRALAHFTLGYFKEDQDMRDIIKPYLLEYFNGYIKLIENDFQLTDLVALAQMGSALAATVITIKRNEA